MNDVLLRGGWVVDGTGTPPYRADVAVAAGRVTDVGVFPAATATQVVDCSGRYVLPGFVDAHSHADGAVFDPDVQLALLRQGVTTVVVGQDGVSYAPGDGRYATGYFAAVNGAHPTYTGHGVADLLAGYDRQVPVNVAALVPHGTVRHQVMGLARRPPTADELARMVRLVAEGLDEGAVGLSSGLDYVPGHFADAAELAAVCGPVAQAGALYVTHMRGGYEGNAGVGVAEVREVAAAAGALACHVSHYHGPAALLGGLVDDARRDGVDLTFDAYPYRRGCTLLAMVLLPQWLQDLGVAESTRRLADPELRRRLARDLEDAGPGRQNLDAGWAEQITLTHVAAAEHAGVPGTTLAAAAHQAGMGAAEFALELLTASRMAVGAVFAFPRSSGDEDLRAMLRHDAHVAGSDGIYVGAHPHPRAWGTFARLLGTHTRDLADYTWGTAAVHLAGHSARRLGLPVRGLLVRGQAADVAVVDPAAVADRATYEEPRRPAVGIADVLVGGVPVLADGRPTGANPGRALRRGEQDVTS